MAPMYYSLNTVLLAVILPLCSGLVKGRVYQTEDAIIIEGQTEFLKYPAVQSTDFLEKTIVTATTSCFTIEGKFGSCTSIHTCYPHSKSSEVNSLTRIIGTRSTCSYVEKNGKQAQGVCCSMTTIGNNDAVTSSGHRTIFMFTANRYDGLAPLYSTLYSYYPYRRVVVPKNPVATMASVPVREMASGQGEFKQSICGAGPLKTLSLDDQRIIGGNRAIKNSWPSIVALKFNGRFLCGGSLISRNKILTAAHCVNTWFMLFVGRMTVELGVHTVNPTSDAELTRRVIRIVRHNRFNINTKRNDIAILTLDSPVTFTSTISPVCLPPVGSDDQYVNQTAAIMGWGSTREDGNIAPILQQASVQIVANSQCKKQYAGESDIVDLMLCARASGIDTCQGDSGGPLLVQLAPESPWTQAAIVSYGIGCADVRYPGVYTRVTSYLRWIQRYM